MTVIAWDGNMLAADRMSLSGYVRGETTKIFRLEPNRLVGLSGNYDCCVAVLMWLRGDRETSSWPEQAQSSAGWAKAIEIEQDGDIFYYERTPYPLLLRMPYHAIGSGAECAIGAMAMGATAVQAVKIAIRFIDGCGGGVDILTF